MQGEDQKKLDVLANNAFIETLSNCGTVCAMVSEEDDGHLTVAEWQKEGKFVLFFPPAFSGLFFFRSLVLFSRIRGQ